MSGTHPSDKLLAGDYLIALANYPGGAVHPKVKEHAVNWVRLCALRATRDPSAWLDTPWRKEIIDAALAVHPDIAGSSQP